jgi:hypothetical protein
MLLLEYLVAIHVFVATHYAGGTSSMSYDAFCANINECAATSTDFISSKIAKQ